MFPLWHQLKNPVADTQLTLAGPMYEVFHFILPGWCPAHAIKRLIVYRSKDKKNGPNEAVFFNF
jgi:hypothetical protein